MKKTTLLTIQSLALTIAILIAAFSIFFSYRHPEVPMEARIGLIALIGVLWVWFFLTHRTPEGGLDPKSFFRKR